MDAARSDSLEGWQFATCARIYWIYVLATRHIPAAGHDMDRVIHVANTVAMFFILAHLLRCLLGAQESASLCFQECGTRNPFAKADFRLAQRFLCAAAILSRASGLIERFPPFRARPPPPSENCHRLGQTSGFCRKGSRRENSLDCSFEICNPGAAPHPKSGPSSSAPLAEAPPLRVPSVTFRLLVDARVQPVGQRALPEWC